MLIRWTKHTLRESKILGIPLFCNNLLELIISINYSNQFKERMIFHRINIMRDKRNIDNKQRKKRIYLKFPQLRKIILKIAPKLYIFAYFPIYVKFRNFVPLSSSDGLNQFKKENLF